MTAGTHARKRSRCPLHLARTQELENLQKADSLLKKLGLKSSIFQVPEGQKAEESQ